LPQKCKRKKSENDARMLDIYRNAIERDPLIINKQNKIYGETCLFALLDADNYKLLEEAIDLNGDFFIENINGESIYTILKQRLKNVKYLDKEIDIRRILSKLNVTNSEIVENENIWAEQCLHKYVRQKSLSRLICLDAIGGHLHTKDGSDKSVIRALFSEIFGDLSILKNANPFVKWWILQATDEHDLSLVHLAALRGETACLKVLYPDYVKPNQREKRRGRTPLHMAAFSGTPDTLECLINFNEDVNAIDFSGNTPLIMAVVAKFLEGYKILFEKGSSVNTKNVTGMTSLHHAALINNLECLNQLIVDGANVIARTNESHTPLHFIADNISVYMENPSEKKNYLECAKVLLSNNQSAANATNAWGGSPLYLAARRGREDLVDLLLQNNGSPVLKSELGRTPLHAAAQYGQSGCIKLLLQTNCILVNEVDKENNTPLHLLCLSTELPLDGKQRCCQLLLEAGASVTAMNVNGNTPLDIANSDEDINFTNLLRSYQSGRASAANDHVQTDPF
jgi:ankyrin repeat protein